MNVPPFYGDAHALRISFRFSFFFFFLLCSVGVHQCACALGYRCVDANTRTYSIQATHTHVRLTFFMLAVGNKTDATKRMRLLAQRAPGLRTNKKKFCLQINTYEIGMKKVWQKKRLKKKRLFSFSRCSGCGAAPTLLWSLLWILDLKIVCSPFINLILALLNIQAGNTAVLWCAYSFGGNSNSFPLTLNFMRIRYLLLCRKNKIVEI